MELNRIKELLEYNPDTGAITWRIARGCVRKGAPAGSITRLGYIRINAGRKPVFAHRIAWALFYGEWPSLFIDHINGDKLDNRIANLRLATKAENAQNVRTIKSNNKTGYIGVYFLARANKWRASIRTNGRLKQLGMFSDPKLASEAYQAAKKVFHPFAT